MLVTAFGKTAQNRSKEKAYLHPVVIQRLQHVICAGWRCANVEWQWVVVAIVSTFAWTSLTDCLRNQPASSSPTFDRVVSFDCCSPFAVNKR